MNPALTEPASGGAVPNRPITREEARAALAKVGADDAAEATWLAAINDSNLSEDTRSDLIEDLNEEGFPDPKHLTKEDLPLIVSRIDLIEQIAPDAMDQTNAEAFKEAYKDLVNMAKRLTKR